MTSPAGAGGRRFVELFRDAIVYGATTAGAQSVQLLLLPLYTRALAQDVYGSVEAIIAGAAILSLVLGLQVDSALARYYYQAGSAEERRRLFGTGLALIALSSLVAIPALLAAAPLIAGFLAGDAGLAWAVRLAVATVPARLVLTYLLLVFRLERQRSRYAVVGIGWVSLGVGFNLVTVGYLDMGILGVFVGLLAADVVSAFFGAVLGREHFAFAFSRQTARQMLRYGLPLVPAASGQWSLRYVDRFFILALLSRYELGIYAAAVQVSSVILFLDRAFALAWTPFAMSAIGEKDTPAVYARALLLYSLAVMTCGVGLMIFAREILGLVAPPAYQAGASLVPLLVGAWIARGVFRVVVTGVSISTRTGYSLLAFAAGIVANVSLLVWLLPSQGLMGAAWAALGGGVVTACAGYRFAQMLFPVAYDLRRIGGMVAVAAGAAAAAALVDVSEAGGVLRVIVKGLLLVGSCYALVGIGTTRGERAALKAYVGRRRRSKGTL